MVTFTVPKYVPPSGTKVGVATCAEANCANERAANRPVVTRKPRLAVTSKIEKTICLKLGGMEVLNVNWRKRNAHSSDFTRQCQCFFLKFLNGELAHIK